MLARGAEAAAFNGLASLHARLLFFDCSELPRILALKRIITHETHPPSVHGDSIPTDPVAC